VKSLDPNGGQAMIALVTGPNRDSLLQIGRTAVEERLAACVNVLDDVVSVYRWQGAIEQEAESLAIFKTSSARLPMLRDRVLELHPYDEPEFVALRVDSGSPSYLTWILDSVAG
jgi:periplasmic divalent cation tolerance protein